VADAARHRGVPVDLVVAEERSPNLEEACAEAGWQRVPVLLLRGGSDARELSNPVQKLIARAVEAVSGPPRSDPFEDFVGDSPRTRELRTLMARIARADCNVLITGETGTGKELVAELIHRNSARAKFPFVCVNCAALPDNLVESELFGYERGAFTGAAATTDGKLQAAEGGTVFFDEIGEMSPHTQAKLLRAIESRQVYRLGGHRQIPLNLRILAATHQDLNARTSSGQFRQDLFYRLNVARIEVPPLRERRPDIRSLLIHYLSRFNQTFARESVGFTESLLSQLSQYDWPGNVRELRNFVESTFVYSSEKQFSWRDIAPHFLTVFRHTPPMESERERVLTALEDTGWNRSLAARRLRMSRMTLYRKMSKHNINRAADRQLRRDSVTAQGA
jgi:DNA-binding NtrC family response regulator